MVIFDDIVLVGEKVNYFFKIFLFALKR